MQSRSIFAASCVFLLCLPVHLRAADEPAGAPIHVPEPATSSLPLLAQADAGASALEYHSAFIAYRSFQAGELVPWAEANARVAASTPNMTGHAAQATGGAP